MLLNLENVMEITKTNMWWGGGGGGNEWAINERKEISFNAILG